MDLALKWMAEYNRNLTEASYEEAIAGWNYATNITDETAAAVSEGLHYYELY